jgi:hypothetical protein
MKSKILIFIMIVLFSFLGASPWEGAAAIAPDGELPEKGRFIATNSFPVNTVVDILNIETNKSTRVIVAGGLESPGLLAVVSREAAEIIGMRSGSIGRIRMIQPSDPIAYLRFTEGLSSGITDYDSGNVLTEENYRPYSPYDSQQGMVANNGNSSGYILEPEWSGPGSRNIIDLPGYPGIDEFPYLVTPDEPDMEKQQKETVEIVEVEEEEQEEPVEIAEAEEEEQEEPVEIAEAEEEEQEEPEEIAEVEEEEQEEPVEIAEVEEQEEPVEIAEAEEEEQEEPVEIAEAEEEKTITQDKLSEDKTKYVLVPAEERKPPDIYGIDPADLIPELGRKEPEAVNIPNVVFTVPVITKLDNGWYYVQLAAFSKPELVENAISSIDSNYKPKVFCEDDNGYRIILGPLYQGESAAVLQRFKSIGYKDAFVRQGK